MINFWERLKKEKPVVLHEGVYEKTESVSSAIFMITGMTIGAGVLGLPYVIAQVGLKIGLFYILILGLIMLFLNLMIGEVAARTREPMHLPGFTGKYLGPWAKRVVSLCVIFASLGSLLAYIIGEGQVLAELFGGNPTWWSVAFWVLGAFLIWRGLHTVKVVEKVIGFSVILIIVLLSIYALKDYEPANFAFVNWNNIFLPYGVILFALCATPAISEAHALLPGDTKRFKKAIIIGSLIPIFVYLFFVLAVVGVTGIHTTSVATVGLGEKLGDGALLAGNIFAIFAVFTCFIGSGVALKRTLTWDEGINKNLAYLIVILTPITLFLLGLKDFVTVLDVVGGLFISIEAVAMVLIYWKAKQKGDLDPGQLNLHHAWLLTVPVFLVFTFFTIYSIIKMF